MQIKLKKNKKNFKNFLSFFIYVCMYIQSVVVSGILLKINKKKKL